MDGDCGWRTHESHVALADDCAYTVVPTDLYPYRTAGSKMVNAATSANMNAAAGGGISDNTWVLVVLRLWSGTHSSGGQTSETHLRHSRGKECLKLNGAPYHNNYVLV